MNTTFGFADGPFDKPGRPFWLQYGNWHRVPHIRAAINDYDWILYSDLDFVIKDLTRPIESFIKQWILYGKNNVHVFVPPENKKSFIFSTFAILVRNSDFGRAFLRNWEEFGRGLCPNGTFEVHNPAQMDILGRIKWEFTDQPGLWYALLQTSIDFDHHFEKGRRLYSKEFCDNETGFLKHLNLYHLIRDFDTFFKSDARTRNHRGTHGLELTNVPDDQPIIWSMIDDEDEESGLAVPEGETSRFNETLAKAFAIHTKRESKRWPAKDMKIDLEMRKKKHGC